MFAIKIIYKYHPSRNSYLENFHGEKQTWNTEAEAKQEIQNLNKTNGLWTVHGPPRTYHYEVEPCR